MTILSRWLTPAALAASLAIGAMTPAPVQAQDTLTRVLVDIADVVFNNGTPYYRYGDYGYDDRLIAGRDRYGRLVYYRQVPYGYNTSRYSTANSYDRYGRRIYDQYGRRIYDSYGRRIDYSIRHDNDYRSRPPYGNAYGYYRDDVKCNKHGKCKSKHHRHGNGHDWDD